MSVAEVLDAQVYLRDVLQDQKSGLGEMAFKQTSAILNAQITDIEGTANQGAQLFISNLQRAVSDAAAYSVAPDMLPLINHAATQLDDSDIFSIDLAPTPLGFVRFESPLVVTDVRGNYLYAHLLTWSPVKGANGQSGTIVYYFNDVHDPDSYAQEIIARYGLKMVLREFGPWQMAGFQIYWHGEPVGPPMLQLTEKEFERLDAGEPASYEFSNLARQLLAFWMLCEQTITDVREAYIPRAARKRIERVKLPARVTTVTLRHVAHRKPEGESQVEHDHRWLVRGHWRWQAYGTNWSERRRIWISDFIKGPDGAPLRTSEKVYRLVR